MAVASKVTIGTGRMVSDPQQSQDVCITVTYELERADTDLLAFVAEKAEEVEQAHAQVWDSIRGLRDRQSARPYPGMNGTASHTRESVPETGSQADHADPSLLDTPTVEPASVPQKLAIQSLADRSGRPSNNLAKLLGERYAKSSLDELTMSEAASLLLCLQRGDLSVPEPASA